jgi:hypothetical protein
LDGGIKALKNRDGQPHLLEKLLSARAEEHKGALYGHRGDPIRGQISRYVDRWKNYSRSDYIIKVLHKFGVPKHGAKKKAVTAPQAKGGNKKKESYREKKEELSVSSLDSSEKSEESSSQEEGAFEIQEVKTISKLKAAKKPEATIPEELPLEAFQNLSMSSRGQGPPTVAGATGSLKSGKCLSVCLLAS